MQIERDFTSHEVTLAFENSGKRMRLTSEETHEFDERVRQIQEDARNGE